MSSKLHIGIISESDLEKCRGYYEGIIGNRYAKYLRRRKT